MAVPVIASFATKEDLANTTSRTIDKPSGTASGDWLVLVMGMDGTGAITTSDFTTIYDSLDSIDSSRFRLAVRKADGTEGANFTIGTAASEEVNAWLGRITGVDSGITSSTLIDALSVCKASAEQSKVIAPAIWTETDDCLIIAAYAQDGGVANAAATGIPSTYTESYQDAGLAAGCGISVVYKSAATAGAVGQPVWTCSTNTDEYVAVQFAIRSTTTPATAPAHPIPKCSVVNLCSSASATFDVVLEVPYGTAQNDGLILEVASELTATTIPADFTQIQKSNTGGFIYFENAYFIADASMPSTYTVSHTNTAAKTAALHLFKNIDTADFPHKNAATSGGAADTAPTAPSVTTTKANCIIWRAFGADDDDLTVGSGFFGSTTGVFSGVTGANADISQQAAYSTQAGTGASGTAAATLGAAEDWVATTLAIAPVAATDVTITGGSGSYAVTGTAASLGRGAEVAGGEGSYAVTGTAASLEFGAEVAAGGGSYAVSGSDATLEYFDINADPGSYTVTGAAASLEFGAEINVDSGSYVVTGAAASLDYQIISAEAGSYSITGQSASLSRGFPISAEAGSYAVTGTAASLEISAEVNADAGSYTVTGQTASLERGAEVAADSGSYAVTGQDATLASGATVNAEAGSYAVSGQASALELGAELSTDAGSYTVTGANTGLLAGYVLAVESGSYGVTGQEIEFLYVPANDDVTTSGGWGYVHPYQAYREKEYERQTAEEKRQALQQIEDDLRDAELAKQEQLAEARAQEKAAFEMAALEAQLQEEINNLRMERDWLMRLMDDEEAIFVLLAMQPFH